MLKNPCLYSYMYPTDEDLQYALNFRTLISKCDNEALWHYLEDFNLYHGKKAYIEFWRYDVVVFELYKRGEL